MGGADASRRSETIDNEDELVSAVKDALGGSGKNVKALVIGALGRCGHGAVDLFRNIGLDELRSLVLFGMKPRDSDCATFPFWNLDCTARSESQTSLPPGQKGKGMAFRFPTPRHGHQQTLACAFCLQPPTGLCARIPSETYRAKWRIDFLPPYRRGFL